MSTPKSQTLRKSIVAVCVLLMTIAGLTAPVSAAPPAAVVRVNSAGDLMVLARADGVSIEINSNIAGQYAVWVTPSDGALQVHNVSGVTRNVTLNYGGYDWVRTDLGAGSATTVPQDLRVLSAGLNSGSSVIIHDVTIGDDLIVQGGVFVDMNGGEVGDDVVASVIDDGWLEVQLSNITVADLLSVRSTGPAGYNLLLKSSSVGRLRSVGGSGGESVRLERSSIGSAPRVSLGGGSDHLAVSNSTWTGTLRFYGDAGNDHFYYKSGSLLHAARAYMGAGDDKLVVHGQPAQAGAGLLLHGGGGVDILTRTGDLREAKKIWIEEFIDG